MANYDVIIVGAGPAGIFAALELIKKNNLKILMIDQGPELEKRVCPVRIRDRRCTICKPCAITSGWGGAGAFSDGKLTLCSQIGGWLSDYLPEDRLQELIDYVDVVYQEFGAPKEQYGMDLEKIQQLRQKAILAEMRLISCRIRHMGTDGCAKVLANMHQFISSKAEIKTKTKVEKIVVKNHKVAGVATSDGESYACKYLIVAPGREGSGWLSQEARKLGLKLENNPVDVGVRIEVPAAVTKDLTEILYESKLIYISKSFQDQVRTFCMNPYGEVSPEIFGDVVLVNGHSYADKKTENTNFALLVSTTFTEPFKEPIAYGKYIARLANLLGGGVIIQTLGDFYLGRRSTAKRIARSTVEPTYKGATPGDLSFVLPYRYIAGITEMIRALDKLAPGINSRNTLLYGVEAKFYSSKLRLSQTLETDIENLYAIGDGAGVTRGLVQSSCSGVTAARAILEKEN